MQRVDEDDDSELGRLRNGRRGLCVPPGLILADRPPDLESAQLSPHASFFSSSTSVLSRMMRTTSATHATKSISRSVFALSRRRLRPLSTTSQARSEDRPCRQFSTSAPASNSDTSSSSASGAGVNTSGASLEPPPAGGHAPSVANSRLLKHTRENALRTPGIVWKDNIEDAPTRDMVVTGRETRKMNVYQAIRDAMRHVCSSSSFYDTYSCREALQ